jgi:hypothetical protein
MTNGPAPFDLESFMQNLLQNLGEQMAEEDDPLDCIRNEFFANSWKECCDGLLAKTSRLRVWPEVSPAPRVFEFEIDTPYKRKRQEDSSVELMPGPVRGRVIYRGDMFVNPEGPCVVVLIDRTLGYFHPNYSRRNGFLCLGDLSNLPPGPIPLEPLLENHIYPIVSYQNRRPMHPADVEAARYFALDPSAMQGLEPVPPLY